MVCYNTKSTPEIVNGPINRPSAAIIPYTCQRVLRAAQLPPSRPVHESSDDFAEVSGLLVGLSRDHHSDARENGHASPRAAYRGRFVSEALDHPAHRSSV